MTCGPISDEAKRQTLERHVTGEGRSATVRATGTFTSLLYHPSAPIWSISAKSSLLLIVLIRISIRKSPTSCRFLYLPWARRKGRRPNAG